jgi:acetyl-CoA C-acetyltransferase
VELARWPAFAAAAAPIAVAPDDLVDLYSCFPAAVQVQARELDIDVDAAERPLTLTGGMTFAGGPLNSYVLHATVTAARRLREGGGDAVITSVSGMLTKPALARWSATPPAAPFASRDVSGAAAAATARCPFAPDGTGAATIVTSTVVHDHDGPAVAVAVVELESGERTIATCANRAVAAGLVDDAAIGAVVSVVAPGDFVLS